MTEIPTMDEVLKEAPKNWGKWGDDDEVGALNYLDVRSRCWPRVRLHQVRQPSSRCSG